MERYVSAKRRFTQDLHSATSQKTAFFLVTAVKTSNLTQKLCYFGNTGKDFFEIKHNKLVGKLRQLSKVKESGF
jgi:hypothetical protein